LTRGWRRRTRPGLHGGLVGAVQHLHVNDLDTGADSDVQGGADYALQASGSNTIMFSPDTASVAWWGPVSLGGPPGGAVVLNVASPHGSGTNAAAPSRGHQRDRQRRLARLRDARRPDRCDHHPRGISGDRTPRARPRPDLGDAAADSSAAPLPGRRSSLSRDVRQPWMRDPDVVPELQQSKSLRDMTLPKG